MIDTEHVVYKIYPEGRKKNALAVLGFSELCTHLQAMVEDSQCDPVIVEATDMSENEYQDLPVHAGW